MQPPIFQIEDINDFIEMQLAVWPAAAENYARLGDVKRKSIGSEDNIFFAQFNPMRIVSTGAKVDKSSVEKRPCFLCKSNRPKEQFQLAIADGWEMLLNPFPILPIHFTVVDTCHVAQESIPLDMATMAERAPGLVFFYNGAKAGASAPDHRHAQGVLQSELPLVALTERNHNVSDGIIKFSENFDLALPFHFVSMIITPDPQGMKMLAKVPEAYGIDADTGAQNRGLVNAYFWIDKTGLLRIVIIPRRRHRPSFYGSGRDEMLVSPGAIDMAGIIITPLEKDFEKIDSDKLNQIYKEVAFSKSLPEEIKSHFES